jgi:hypothetical protein
MHPAPSARPQDAPPRHPDPNSTTPTTPNRDDSSQHVHRPARFMHFKALAAEMEQQAATWHLVRGGWGGLRQWAGWRRLGSRLGEEPGRGGAAGAGRARCRIVGRLTVRRAALPPPAPVASRAQSELPGPGTPPLFWGLDLGGSPPLPWGPDLGAPPLCPGGLTCGRPPATRRRPPAASQVWCLHCNEMPPGGTGGPVVLEAGERQTTRQALADRVLADPALSRCGPSALAGQL